MAWLSCLRQKEPQITRLNSILSRGHGQSLCARTFTFEPITTRNTFGYFCRSFLGHDSTPSFLAQQLVAFTQGNATATTLAVLWGSGFLSANIPYVAAMNPLIVDLARTLHPDVADYTALEHQPDILPLWWALGLGACLGGNGTMIGASADVIVIDLARRDGHRITSWVSSPWAFR